MRRCLPWVLVAVLGVGWAFDHNLGDGPRKRDAAIPPLEEFSIVRYDSAAPGSMSSERYTVTRMATEGQNATARVGEVAIVHWRPERSPGGFDIYFGLPK